MWIETPRITVAVDGGGTGPPPSRGVDVTPEERMQLIQQLYDKLPELTGCKGLCAGSCTDIDMSELERERIQHRHGIKIRTRSQVEVERTGPKRCKALGK